MLSNILLIFILFIIIILLLNNKQTFYVKKLNKKQKQFSKCLFDMKKILDKNNVDFFLCWGTLLGQKRENQFIEHDHDIDIGILNTNYNDSIKKKIIESGVFSFRHEFGKIENCYECTFIHKQTKISIDIFIFYQIKSDLYYTSTHTGKCNNTKQGYCKWGRHLRGFKNVNFMDQTYKVPKNTEEYLEESYGKNWKIPIKFNYYEGLSKKLYKNLLN